MDFRVLPWGVLDRIVRYSSLSRCLVSSERRAPTKVCYVGRFCHRVLANSLKLWFLRVGATTLTALCDERPQHMSYVRLSYNPPFSACFFSRNSVFLSQQISQNSVSVCFFSKANRANDRPRPRSGPDRHLRPGDLVGAPTERLAVVRP